MWHHWLKSPPSIAMKNTETLFSLGIADCSSKQDSNQASSWDFGFLGTAIFLSTSKIWQDTILHVITILLKDGGHPPVKRTSEYQKPTTRKNGRNSFTPFQENQGP